MTSPAPTTGTRAAQPGYAVLLVTHDEDLIDEVATRIWHFEGTHEISDFKGAYGEYEAVVV